ncbi:uroporphyrinogen-III synthase [Vibrio sp. T187]|uniref:uroporphyrinogen-III synthase n=1 Tax=Vibrio TaxID=662 RepID=UPI0010C9FF85|nr:MULTISPECIES: uroporphyrinogen-III synthase [Vibrio]MBW3698539.1 uroporphyrinogen-III synthase [Vibrio sp. T187]
MAVLVTRPGSEGLTLCQQLADAGIPSIHHPLIRIVENQQASELSTKLTNSDIVIAVSQHAVSSAQTILLQQHANWPQDVIYLGVGQKTAHKLSKATQQIVNYPDTSDSEHLLQLNELQDISGKTITILRGNGGRELIRDSLISQGAKVDYCETYHREFIAISSLDTFQHWKDNDITQVVITSQGQLEFLTSSTPPEYLPWLQQQQLFVPSQRIAARALQLGFSHVENTVSASNQILVASLQP